MAEERVILEINLEDNASSQAPNDRPEFPGLGGSRSSVGPGSRSAASRSASARSADPERSRRFRDAAPNLVEEFRQGRRERIDEEVARIHREEGRFAAAAARTTSRARAGGAATRGATGGTAAAARSGAIASSAAGAIAAGGLVVAATAAATAIWGLRAAAKAAQESMMFSPEVVNAQMNAEFRRLLGELAQARRLGPELARNIDARSELEEELRALRVAVLQQILPLINSGIESITEIVRLLNRQFGIEAEQVDFPLLLRELNEMLEPTNVPGGGF